MRKILAQVMVSLDGYIEDSKNKIDWHVVDSEYHSYSLELLKSADYLVFGRKTYEHMAAFWPTPMTENLFPETAKQMNETQKIVISSTLKEANWKSTELINQDVASYFQELKKESNNKNIVILSSSVLSDYLLKQKLIDEFHIIVNPVLLGGGTPYFKKSTAKLRLVETHSFLSGNVRLRYAPIYK
ncbi:dihydrofolate reductase family protein [Alkalihalobacillus sp. 1P02AB]|uniref:dihydrofolate reductase family protein n=1 Tax=Alkalihalobacillus sp. 1P02AB TaxID=3132260 RepID=UPI0039A6BCB6